MTSADGTAWTAVAAADIRQLLGAGTSKMYAMDAAGRPVSVAHKEHGDGVGAYVAAGAEVVGGVDETTDFDAFLDFFHDIEGVFVSVCVGDSDDLFFRFYDVVTDEGD